MNRILEGGIDAPGSSEGLAWTHFHSSPYPFNDGLLESFTHTGTTLPLGNIQNHCIAPALEVAYFATGCSVPNDGIRR